MGYTEHVHYIFCKQSFADEKSPDQFCQNELLEYAVLGLCQY